MSSESMSFEFIEFVEFRLRRFTFQFFIRFSTLKMRCFIFGTGKKNGTRTLNELDGLDDINSKPMNYLDKFKQTNALLEGHFILSSGLHSPNYLQCALALQDPKDAAEFGRAIAGKLAAEQFDTVASPAIGGLIIGYATAQALGVRFIWTERENGVMTLRRGFTVNPGERILVVEDVITTGGSTRECIEALEKQGAKVVAAASIIDRSGGTRRRRRPARIARQPRRARAIHPKNCPMCAQGLEAVKPGSRTPRQIMRRCCFLSMDDLGSYVSDDELGHSAFARARLAGRHRLMA